MIEKFKQSYEFAKQNFCKERVIFNYIAIPSLLAFGFCDVIVVLLLLTINSKKYLTTSIVLFVLMVVLFIVLLCFMPYVKKKEVRSEITRIKAFFQMPLLENPVCEYVLPRSDTKGAIDLCFTDKGYNIGNLSYTYEGFDLALCTSNYMYKASLIVLFKRNEVGDKEDGENKGVRQFSLPLDLNLLSIINKFDLKIVNPDVLKFVRENTEEAVKQIMRYGKVQNNYYKTR